MIHLIPSRSQYKAWSLPSKLGFWGFVIGAITLVWSIILWMWPSPRPSLPQVTVRTSTLELPGPGDNPISPDVLRDRRLQIIEIRNPNKMALSNMELKLQFPESVMEARPSEKSASFGISLREDWDEQHITFTGDVSGVPIEPFAIEQKTGLWKLFINTIPPEATIRIKMVSTIGPEAEIYRKGLISPRIQDSDGLKWLIYGSYQFTLGAEAIKSYIVAPLRIDSATRAISVGTAREGSLDDGEWVRVQQGRGARMAGILSIRGYLVIRGRNDIRYYAPVMLERAGDVDVQFGLFGNPPTLPGFEVRFKNRDTKGYRSKARTVGESAIGSLGSSGNSMDKGR